MGIDEKFLKLVESCLSNRYQSVVLNGQASFRVEIKAGVRQLYFFLFTSMVYLKI